MVQLIIGLKGSGKTKKLVDMVRDAVNEETGDVVCIEKERKLTFDTSSRTSFAFTLNGTDLPFMRRR